MQHRLRGDRVVRWLAVIQAILLVATLAIPVAVLAAEPASPAPTATDSPAPTDSPTPTDQPTDAPTDQPTDAPTDSPTDSPTDAPPALDPTLATDQTDYYPGQVVHVVGGNWPANSDITLRLYRDDPTDAVDGFAGDPISIWTTTTDDYGILEDASWTMTFADWNMNHKLVADGPNDTEAVTYFQDSLASDCFRSTGAGGNWATVGTWESAAAATGCTAWAAATIAPTSSATSVEIRAGSPVTVAGNASARVLTVDTGATLTVNTGVNFVITHTSGDDCSAGVQPCDVTINGTATITGTGVFQSAGTLASAVSGIISSTGTVTVGVGGLLEITRNFTLSSGGTLTDNGTVTIGSAANTASTLNAAFNVPSGATLNVNSPVTTNAALSTSGTISIASTGSLTVGSGGSFTTNAATTLANGGLTVQSGGTFTANATTTFSGTWNQNSGSTFNFSADVNANGTSVIGLGISVPIGRTLTISGGTFTDSASLTIDGSVLSDTNSQITLNGATTLHSGGTFNGGGGNGSTDPDIFVGGTFTIDSGAAANGTSSVGQYWHVNSGGTLQVNGSIGGSTMGLAILSGGIANVTGSVTLASVSLLEVFSGGALNLSGTATVSGTRGNGGTVIAIDAGGSATLTGTSSISPLGTGSMNVAGTLDVGPTATVTGNSFTLAGGGTLKIGSTAGITSSGATGNVQTSTRTFATTANYEYKGSAAQVTGNGLPLTVNNFTVSNTGGTVTPSNASLTVSGTLSVAASAELSRIATAFTLTLAGSVSNAGAITLDGTASGCGDTDNILIRSSVAGTQRSWTGAGTFNLTDVDVKDMTGTAAITVKSGTNSGNNGANWTFGGCVASTATLVVIKHVVNNNGGTAVAANWNLAVSSSNGGTGTGSAAGAESPGTTYTIQAGKAYSVAESGGPTGYAESDSTDCNIASATGGTTYTCTITNDDIAPTLTVKKHVVTDNGGTAVAGNWTLTVSSSNGGSGTGNAAGSESGTLYTLQAGKAYSVAESGGPSGYAESDSANCTIANATLGSTYTCTITNDDIAPTILVKKHVVNDNGGSAVAANWTLTLSSSNGGSGTGNAAGTESGTLYTIQAGKAYSVGESSGPTGYGLSASANCTIAAAVLNTAYVCTMTNDDQAASLTIIKHVINNNGGSAAANAWTMDVTATSPSSNHFAGAESPGTTITINAGSYSVAESGGVSGYSLSSSAQCSGTAVVGGSYTCTLTNDDIAPTLTVKKHVVDDNGGTAAAGDWTLALSSSNGGSGTGTAAGSESGTLYTLQAGKAYSVGESGGPSGYAASSSADCSIASAVLGATYVCTITNDDIAPTLTVKKHVITDNGGTAAAGDWLLTVSSSNSGSGTGNAAGSETGTVYTLQGGKAYSVAESGGPAGYAESDSTDCSIASAAIGTSYTCTITNNDIAPTITVKKHVVNDNGGTAVAANWNLALSSSNGGSGTGNAAGSESGTLYTLQAGKAYSVGESGGPSGYAASSSADCSIASAVLNTAYTCTITNNDIAPTLTLVKHVTNNDGGQAQVSDFPLFISAAPTTSGTAVTLTAGVQYTASETSSTGYSASAWSGDCAADGTITLSVGQTATCDITNDDVAPTLKLVKFVTNNDGGNAQAGDWTLYATAAAPNDGRNFNNAGDAGDFTAVFANTGYDLSESALDGYSASAWQCDGGSLVDSTVTLAVGANVTCWLTNDDIAPTLKLVKDVTNDNGGNATADDWTLYASAAAPNDDRDFSNAGGSGTAQSVYANVSYDLSESTLAGYANGTWQCDGGLLTDTTLVLAAGDVVTCTITNNDVAPKLTIVKNVINNNGGTAGPGDFGLTIGGDAAVSGTAYTLNANTPYAIDEAGLTGYQFVSITGDASCPAVLGGTITLDEGADVTCYINNDDIAPTLTLVKHVTNDDGGNAQVSDFPLFVDATPATSGNAVTLTAGVKYTASETSSAGYSASVWSGDCAADGTITLSVGQNATCDITNDDVAPTLKLVKYVTTDDGGTATADDWTLHATADAPNDGRNFNNAGGSGDFQAVYANTDYLLSEDGGPNGYSPSLWDCDGGSLVDNVVSLSPGDTVTCSITNDDIAPTLTLVKTVINDNGGTAHVSDFPLFINGYGVTSGIADTLVANTLYTATETSQPGYTAGSWTGDCAADGTITLSPGENATCYLTNDDQQAYITVVKHVINDDGGTAGPDDFGLTLNNNPVSSGVAVAVNPGTYTANETGLAGYSFEGYSGDCSIEGDIHVSIGQSLTCTLTNNDIAPTLTLVKTVVNNNGGNDQVSDFPLFIDATSATSGTPVTLTAGIQYTASETGSAGYAASDWTGSCNADGTITLEVGQNATCYLTNDDIAPTLTLVKTVINDNGGSAQISDFKLYVDATQVTSGVATALDSNTQYTASEDNLPGYTAGDWTGDCNADGTITLTEGQNATCYLTNDDQQAYITVTKSVTNDDGGTAGADDFGLTLNGDAVSSGVAVPVDPGTYTAAEAGLAGYAFGSFAGDCDGTGSITIALGQSMSCTISNDDVAPTLKLVKSVHNTHGGNAVADDWTLYAAASDFGFTDRNFNNLGGSGSATAVYAGHEYVLSESTVPGYVAGSWQCDGGLLTDDTLTLALGDVVTCTITNDDVAPKLTLTKHVTNDNGGNASADDFGLTIGGDTATSGTQYTLMANTPYALDEAGLTGYQFVSITGDAACPAVLGGTITLNEGDVVSCTINNDDVAPTLKLVKYVTNDDGGNAQVSDFPLFISGNATTSGTAVTLDSNTQYTASETNKTGYTASVWSGDCAADGTITLTEGENATCYITNNDVAPTLKLVKYVTNDDGGNAVPNDWTLYATASDVTFTDRNFSNAGGSGVYSTVYSNHAYVLSESVKAGYTNGTWACSGGHLTGSSLTIDEGQNVRCWITNNDVAPTLKLVKYVTNDDGGNAQVSDFPLFISGNGTTSGVAVVVKANTLYTATETNQTGYAASVWSGDCAASGTITLTSGQNATCYITNNDIAPTITLTKSVTNNNGGAAGPNDFGLTIGGTPATSGTQYTLKSNQAYAINEAGLSGYQFTGITGSVKCPAALGGTITLDEGENVSCTISNDDQPATLTIIKHVVNNNGGTAQASAFTMVVTATSPSSNNFAGAESPGTTININAGSFSVGESGGPGGYALSKSGVCSGTAVVGGSYTCTLTNDDIQPTVKVTKTLVPASDPGRFNLLIDGTTYATNVGDTGTTGVIGINAGVRSISETAGTVPVTSLANYTSAINCGAAGSGSGTSLNITLKPGDVVNCTITNSVQDTDGDGIPNFLDCTTVYENRVVDPTGKLTAYLPASRRFTTLQAAVNAAVDNDVISVYADLTENVEIGGSGVGASAALKDLRIIGCGHKVTAAVSSKPVINVFNNAGKNDGNTGAGEADIQIEDLDVRGGTIGYLIQTTKPGGNNTNTLLKAIRSTSNGIGVSIQGSGNELRNANSISLNTTGGVLVNGNVNNINNNRIGPNTGYGLSVTGTSNIIAKNTITGNSGVAITAVGCANTQVTENNVFSNGGGITVGGNGSTIAKNDVGDSGQGNTGDGITFSGGTSSITENNVFANTGRGIVITGNTNVVGKNDVGDSGKGNNGGGVVINGNSNDVGENNIYANNGVGLNITGNTNSLHKNEVGDKNKGNTGDGIRLTGDGNTVGVNLDENDVYANGGNGIVVTGNSNILSKNNVGDTGKGNSGDGLHIVGYGNNLSENSAYANTGDGFDVSGGTAAKPNVLVKNNSGKSGAGNGGNGFLIGGAGNPKATPTELDSNTAKGNQQNGFYITGTGFDLSKNTSGGSSGDDNVHWEFYFTSTGNWNLGSNKFNSTTVAGTTPAAFAAGGLGTP